MARSQGSHGPPPEANGGKNGMGGFSWSSSILRIKFGGISERDKKGQFENPKPLNAAERVRVTFLLRGENAEPQTRGRGDHEQEIQSSKPSRVSPGGSRRKRALSHRDGQEVVHKGVGYSRHNHGDEKK